MKTLILIIALAFTSFVAGQQVPKYHAKVKLSVSADEAIKGEITSFMSRELRELTDVSVVEENPQWEIQVLAMESKLKNGYTSGVVISVVLFQHHNPGIFDAVFDKNHAEAAKKMTAGLVFYPDHWIRSGSTEQLKDICQGIVADFDSGHLERGRKGFAEILKETEERLKK